MIYQKKFKKKIPPIPIRKTVGFNSINNSFYLDEINNSAMFWNWRGFDLGKGSIWFFVNEDGSIGNLSIYVD